ncbi:glycoside hydrolase family 65 protein [Clostridioides sp. ZZV14-6154]|uniref:glycoside hydrolase family 65 protein n=1 Tax=unclassified Clostridioides TaxID=2635829 RepID=UPI001D0F8880|nr:glycoside hydrolase family 65 protein [Clostridioides sp. ZZV14-6154]MCC0744894.1 glycoside hydrolase family 65 protein [Clostridioides sp. ZZV14-6044]WLD28513.1 Maltose phosphorylase [Clostridioides difficile]
MKCLFDNINEWKIIQDKIEIKENRLAESIMSIGNGYMGMRGNYEERYSGDSHRGSYIAGVWFPDKTRVGWWKNGYPEYFGKIPNSVNYIGIRIFIDGVELDLAKCNVENFYRELDMKNGILKRKFTVNINGKKFEANITRFLSISVKELAVIKYDIKALNSSAKIKFIPYLDSNIKNEDSNYEEEFWNAVSSSSSEYRGKILSRTKENTFNTPIFTVGAMMHIKTRGKVDDISYLSTDNYCENSITMDILENETIGIEKYVTITSTRDYGENELLKRCEDILNIEIFKDYEDILNKHTKLWNKRWESADIKIEGDKSSQQGIRYNLFQLFSTYYGEDSRLNIGPKGFTGEKYGGATYWDTEAFCLPVYLGVADKSVARNLLVYRYNQLKQAKDNAKKLGLKGALYPMVTFDGVECHNEWEITFEEIHRNGSIVYAIYNYTNYTGDFEYIKEKGIDVIIEVARFWASRVHLSTRKGLYMIHGVTGPNEYENNINNNWYTNYIAKWCLEYAIENVLKLEKEYSECIERNNISREEIEDWKIISKKMYLPYDEELQIIVQNDNFLDKEFIEVKDLPKENLPLNQKWSWDKILRSCFIKQADVLQGIYYFGNRFTKEEKKRNFDFYERYTVHESSLSSSVYSIIASEVDNLKKAYELYSRTARLDLDNYNNDTNDGLHITSMSGSWLSIVHGFAGMRTWNETLSFEPRLPQEWKNYSFNINYRDNNINVDVYSNLIKIENLKGKPIRIIVYGKEYILEKSIEIDRNKLK